MFFVFFYILLESALELVVASLEELIVRTNLQAKGFLISTNWPFSGSLMLFTDQSKGLNLFSVRLEKYSSDLRIAKTEMFLYE